MFWKQCILAVASAALLFSLAGAASAAVVTLANGDVINASVVSQDDKTVVISHPTLGDITLPVDKVSIEGEKPRPGLFGTSLFAGWSRRLQLGINGSDGNADTLSGIGGLELFTENDDHRWKVDGAYNFVRSDDETTANNGYLQLTKDWLFPGERYFTFALARYDRDAFRDWDHRVNAAAGLGYAIVDGDGPLALNGRLGAGVSQTFGGTNDELTPEILAGIEGVYSINDRQRLTFYTTFFPSLRDVGEFRNLSGTAWIVDIAPADGLSLKFGVDNQYISERTPAKKNDVVYYGALLVDF